MFAELSPPYATIVADPPWRYVQGGNNKTDAAARYSVLTVAEIAYLPVGDLVADDSHAWVWATNAMMEQAHRVLRSWGFNPTTILTWCKPGPGVGHYLRNNTEHAILGIRGRSQVPKVKPISSWFQWPRAEHSAKPAAFYDLVEQVSPAPRLELFSRTPRLGWDSWGHGYETERGGVTR